MPASNRESRARRIPLDIKVLDPAKVNFAALLVRGDFR